MGERRGARRQWLNGLFPLLLEETHSKTTRHSGKVGGVKISKQRFKRKKRRRSQEGQISPEQTKHKHNLWRQSLHSCSNSCLKSLLSTSHTTVFPLSRSEVFKTSFLFRWRVSSQKQLSVFHRNHTSIIFYHALPWNNKYQVVHSILASFVCWSLRKQNYADNPSLLFFFFLKQFFFPNWGHPRNIWGSNHIK